MAGTDASSEGREQPRVGVGLFVHRGSGDGLRFLLMLRHGAHGAGTWGLVGGKLEFGETPRSTAVDEALQEVGLILDPAQVALGPYTNDVFADEGKHYVTLYASVPMPEGQEPRLMEPHRCLEIGWFGFSDMPGPLFLPLRHFLRQPVRPPFGP